MKLKNVYILLIVYCLLPTAYLGKAQEVLTDLTINATVAKYYSQQSTLPSFKTAKITSSTVNLPFRDDFAREGVYPDTAWWESSNSVFINRDYARNPLSIGVATFEGLDSTGYPYNFGASSNSTGFADRLVSKPINLAGLTKGDSLYLSFFYQAKGLGNAPEAIDSLMLEFKSPTKNWTRKWVKAGYTPTSVDTLFHRVMVSVNDTAWFKNGFQFRFRNYATLSGNVDHWHLDYVYLDSARSMADTIFQDVSFAYNGTAFLKIYQSMPWNQFTASDKAGSTRNWIRNNDSAVRVTNYMYEVLDRNKNNLYTYNPGNNALPPFATSGYSSNPAHATPPFTYNFPAITDTTFFIIQHVLNNAGDKIPWNDTLRFYQKYYDYYSYDDGTAEAAYGLNQTGSMLAMRFQMNVKDTLKGIQYYWNPVINNQSSKGFRPTVWTDNSGTPGNIIFQDSVRYPVYDKKGHNYFHQYFTTSTIIPLSGIFWCGWTQVGTDVLNVGMDLNINNNNKFMYNVTGSWQTSLVLGSPMIRPVFKCGKDFFSGIEEQGAEMLAKIYPNPANDRLYIDTEGRLTISVSDIAGRQVLRKQVEGNTSIDISSFSTGLYLVRMSDEKGHTLTRKLAVSR